MSARVPDRIDPRVRSRRWIDPEVVPHSIEPLHDHKLLHALLYRRGLRNRNDANRFLGSDPRQAIDPYGLPDFGRAVERIVAAVRNDERIGIFGDYDVDGATSAAMLGLALRAAGTADRVSIRLPHRSEGYGLSGAAIDEFFDAGVRLLVALDCGSSDHGPVAYARALGMEVVIADHHQMRDDGPSDAIVVSAYRPGAGHLKELSAAGLIWLLVDALFEAGLSVAPDDADPDIYLDLAALGLIGDVSRMTGASRILTRAGIDRLARHPRPGIAALARLAKIEPSRMGATDISFRLTPRLNAAGRMADPSLALRLLLAPDLVAAERFALEIEQLNSHRKTATEQIVRMAEQMIQQQSDWEKRSVLVVHAENWQIGVVGIVAARLVEIYNRPAVVLCEEAGGLRGSMRAPDGFDVVAALDSCSSFLRSYGGHRAAGGLSLDSDRVEDLTERLDALAADRIVAVTPSLRLDAELQEKHLNLEIARLVHSMEPFGPGNEEPVFVLRNTRLQRYDTMGQNKQHLSLMIGNGRPVRAAFFNAAHRSRELVGASRIDIAFTLGESDWNGPRIDMHVKDFRVNNG